MIRSICAIVIGIIVGAVLIMAGHLLSLLVFPLPAGLDWKDPEAMRAYAATMPDGAFVLVLLSHAMGPLGGGWLAARVARRAKVVHALLVGAFFLVGGIWNLFDLPHPRWFAVAEVLMYLPVAYAGALLAPRKPAQPIAH